MPWITTKTGKHINTDWFDDEEKKKQEQIAKNQAEASRSKAAERPATLADRLNEAKTEKEMRQIMEEELIPKDSYVHSEEYRKAVEDIQRAKEEQEKVDARIKELRKIIKEEEIDEEVLTEADFEDEYEWAAYQEMMESPIYREMFAQHTEKGEAAKKELEKLTSSDSSPMQQAESRLESIKRKESKKQIEDFRKNYKSTVSENVKESYEGFEKDTHTNYLQELYEQGKAHIVEMSPEEYLHYCAHVIFPAQGYNSTYESQLRVAAMADISTTTMKLVKLMQGGTKMYMPSLDFKKNEQEGRHRAVAAMILGIKRMPVMIVPKR